MSRDAAFPPGPDGTSEEEAAAWFARLRGENGARHQGAFEQWRAASPDHERAFARIEAVFEGAAVLHQSKRYGPGHITSAPAPSRRGPQIMALAAGVILAISLGLGFIAYTSAPRSQQPALAVLAFVNEALTTPRGQIHKFQLPDGTTITLDTASRVRVVMDRQTRRIRLEAGKARFAVARDPRPFLVEAGAGRVAAQTGVFDVAYGTKDEVAVTLIDGIAEVRPMISHANFLVPVAPLLRGQVYRYGAAEFSNAAALPASAVEDTRDWPQGWIEYRRVPLRHLIDDANRYARLPIVIDDASADLAASGRFHLTDSVGLAAHLAEVFDLKVTHTPDSIRLGRPTKISRGD
jgi:transmembrane sensor